MSDIDKLRWPLSRLAEAVKALAQQCHLSPHAMDLSSLVAPTLEDIAEMLAIDLEAVTIPYRDIDTFLTRMAPAIVQMTSGKTSTFLLLVKSRGNSLQILAPDGVSYWISISQITKHLRHPCEREIEEQITTLLDKAKIPAKRRQKVSQALFEKRLASQSLKCFSILRPAAHRGLRQILTRTGVVPLLLLLLFAHIAQHILWIISWWIIGSATFTAHFDEGSFFAWSLVLLTIIPFRAVATWAQGKLAVLVGGVFKKQILYGAMCIDSEKIRHLGSGDLLARVYESEIVESLAISGGFTAVLACLEMLVACWVLFINNAWLHLWLFVVCLATSATILRKYHKIRNIWTQSRLRITNDLVEKMVGHRTRMVQESKENWHHGEDEAIVENLAIGKTMDRLHALILAIPRGWLTVAIVALSPLVLSGATATDIAISLGGVLLIYQALYVLVTGMIQLVTAAISWTQVAPFFTAAAKAPQIGLPIRSRLLAQKQQKSLILKSQQLFFRYPQRLEPVLQEGNLTIYEGDRILLEGPSGSGKSTLAAILSGLRRAQGGLLLLHGLDRHVLGENEWRRHIATAPQFHENHIFAESFLFNLLMGCNWPPTQENFQQAVAVCKELGLDSLIHKMPGGLLQMIGETGWQLSQGEKSRVYIARTLLQKADLVILDESFAALDPHTMKQCLECVLRHSPTLLVIAHP